MNEEKWLNPDPDVVVGICPACGEEIYKGELIREVDGERFHEDCLYDWIREHYPLKEAE